MLCTLLGKQIRRVGPGALMIRDQRREVGGVKRGGWGSLGGSWLVGNSVALSVFWV